MAIKALFTLRKTTQMHEMQKLDRELHSLRRTYKNNRTDTALVAKLSARAFAIGERRAVLQSELGVVRPQRPLPYNADQIGLGLQKVFDEYQAVYPHLIVRLSEKPAKWDAAQKYLFHTPMLLEPVQLARIDGVAFSYDRAMGFQQYGGASQPKRPTSWLSAD